MPTMNLHYMAPRAQIVHIMDRIYHGGMTTLSGGNLSIRDEDGAIWITPAGIDKGRLREEDIMCVRPDGQTVGPHRPSSELPFHRAIYAQRPDIRAIVHAHAPALVTFSIVRRLPDTNLIPQARRVCGRVGYAPYALPGSEELGRRIAEAFGQGFDAVLLENHGVATGGATLLEAYQRLETLDFLARTQMHAQRLGPLTTLTDEQVRLADHRDHLIPEFPAGRPGSREAELRSQMADFVQRACRRQLMISTEGVLSARVSEDAYLITPTGCDRHNLNPEDFVLIRGGMREAGKIPSRSINLHTAIYRQHPEIHAVITAQSPHATAFAVSESVLDTRTIPESYIMLVDVPRIPYGMQYHQPDAIAARLSAHTPVLLIQNDCVLTIGRSILNAFDRLEVLEFTARSLIEAADVGQLVPMGSERLEELQRAFAHLMG